MKVTQLHFAGEGSRHDLSIDRLGPELNVFYGPPRSGKSAVAQLVGHLLYGKSTCFWRRQDSAASPLAEGSLHVDSAQGQFVLRRRRDGTPQGRLMVASAAGAAVDNRTVRTLLCEVSPRLLAELYATDFSASPRVQTLLDGEFSRQFTHAVAANHDAVRAASASDSAGSLRVDRRRIDALVRRRDEVVRQIEEHMNGQLRESATLEAEIDQVEAVLGARRHEAEQVRVQLNAAQSQLAEVEARLRLTSLETSMRLGPAIDADAHRTQLSRLDAEIARCRQTLADLQARQATVRHELAEVQPDGAADGANVLADQRATVAVLERLLDDLDAEVAQLARALEPGRPVIGPDAHARLAPVAEMLRHELYALCGQVTEQERAAQRTMLTAESRQLDRALLDFSEQLSHLLERRQALVRTGELAARPLATLAQPPVARHCQCERHDEFIRRSGSMLLTRPDRLLREDEARRRRLELERDRDALRASYDALEQEAQELAARWQQLQQRRAQATGRSNLDVLHRELDQLEAEINRTLLAPAVGAPPAGASHRRLWKASDALAQLSDGQLTQVRRRRDGREAVVVDRAGRTLSPTALTPAQQDQLYLALTLALVSSLANRGVDLPLVLDEPFLRQDPASVRVMAGVLAEFAREGRQVLVFTGDSEAARRFASLGIELCDIDQLRRGTSISPPELKPEADVAATVRVVREPIGESTPKLRLAAQPTAAREEHEIYYLTVDAPLAEFPVLGSDTNAAFSAIGLRTVEDVLRADAGEVAQRLKRPGVTTDAVRLWQRHMSLMCYVPGVSLGDAQVLTACDIGSPEALYAVDVRLLGEAVNRFLASDRGRRFASARHRVTRDRLGELQKLARRGQDRWQAASERYPWVERAKSSPTPAVSPSTRAGKRRTSSIVQHVQRVNKLAPLQFLLEQSSPVERAPSVGPAAAQKLATVGIRTVADLINSNPESTSQELGVAEITPAVITRWQQEARLACRIPGLRSYGARLLVACGLTEPEQVTSISREELVKRVRAIVRTPAGRQLLRNQKAPSAARISGWIRQAAHMRPLEAA